MFSFRDKPGADFVRINIFSRLISNSNINMPYEDAWLLFWNYLGLPMKQKLKSNIESEHKPHHKPDSFSALSFLWVMFLLSWILCIGIQTLLMIHLQKAHFTENLLFFLAALWTSHYAETLIFRISDMKLAQKSIFLKERTNICIGESQAPFFEGRTVNKDIVQWTKLYPTEHWPIIIQ